VLIGIVVHRPSPPWLWALAGAGFGLWTAGDAISALLALDGGNVPVPSWADLASYAGYVALIVSVGLLAGPILRGSHLQRPGLLDAGIVAITAAFLIWLVVIAPVLHAPDSTLLEAVVAAGHPFSTSSPSR
jgi:hypothetical protein